jgi:hypothetical protein
MSRPPSGARGLGLGVEQRGQPDRSRTGADDGSACAGAGSIRSHGSAGAWQTAAALGRSRVRVATCAGVRLCVSMTAGQQDAAWRRPAGVRVMGKRCGALAALLQDEQSHRLSFFGTRESI